MTINSGFIVWFTGLSGAGKSWTTTSPVLIRGS
jgi:adenylylsulfate kinase-like enzyme